MLERIFKLSQLGTNIRVEIVAGLTTFMTMAYIIFANPMILSGGGVPLAGAAAATCLAAALPTLLMGTLTNYPIALAPGMGLNAILAFQVAKVYGWPVAMGVIFVEGAIISICVLTGLRQVVMDAIPQSLKISIAVGIGLLIAFIGLANAGIVQKSEAGVVTYGSMRDPGPIIAGLGLLVIMFFMAKRLKGAILLGIVATAILAFILKAIFPGFFGGVVPSLTGERLVQAPDFSTFGGLDILGALRWSLAGVILAFLLTDFFDTMGTVIAIGRQMGVLTPEGRLPRIFPVLFIDSFGACWGGICGASSATCYIESAAGVAAGGRTGLTSVVVAVLFLLALVFSPIVKLVPAQAVAPALFVVGYLMMKEVIHIDFGKFEEAFPSFLTLLVIPLTYSISHGIGWGFISYAVIKLVTGKGREVHPLLYIVALFFAVSFVYGM
jgi:AGZA family xanthine/uracil permease-like MFS transporter